MKKRRSMTRAEQLFRNPIFRVMHAAPLPVSQRVDLNVAAHSALEDIMHGRGVSDHLDTLACAANVSMVLAEREYGANCHAEIVAAQDGITRAIERVLEGKSVGFDGPAVEAVRTLLDIHQQQIDEAGQVELIDALLEVRRRMATGQVLERAHA